MTIPRKFHLLLCSLKGPRARRQMSNIRIKYSPGYSHMICIGKTKSTSEKGLLKAAINKRSDSDKYLLLVKFGLV